MRQRGEGSPERGKRGPAGTRRGGTEKYVSSIFTKLRLPDTGGEYRRVLAVLRFLRS